ncbi:hypothetical protein BU25DRAFT_415034 [Macroventuria anomochaeta]|uniref:Uncharacterized protein n=1 Tax=Macroventuria anomochaeta TaxID=301207 RepID=A0ACB6RLW3_9PLEO|nr:uncharacterized protein BU25DRAFT_415034 [Macroventuria anomochaeta]KAF2622788.1 hypothetical protein BU25DRAFT_415034 [Macroventuria anomochaeta]
MSNESESSLTEEDACPFYSSPPRLTQYSTPPMDDVASKSEPAAPPDGQQTPKRPRHKRVNSDDTERPASAQRGSDDSEEHPDVEAEQEASDEEDADPAVQIANFDWGDLHQRYHEAINQCSQEEAGSMGEWNSLMEYFRIWANSGHEHETDRTFQRLQTRTIYVQNEEDELENKRNHYINVVRAFESALNLLKANGMFRG